MNCRVPVRPSRVSLLLLFISLLLGMRVAHAQDDPLSRLDAYVQQAMNDWQVPGVAIAVVKDDVVVFEKGYGVREVGQVAEVNEQIFLSSFAQQNLYCSSSGSPRG